MCVCEMSVVFVISRVAVAQLLISVVGCTQLDTCSELFGSMWVLEVEYLCCFPKSLISSRRTRRAMVESSCSNLEKMVARAKHQCVLFTANEVERGCISRQFVISDGERVGGHPR